MLLTRALQLLLLHLRPLHERRHLPTQAARVVAVARGAPDLVHPVPHIQLPRDALLFVADGVQRGGEAGEEGWPVVGRELYEEVVGLGGCRCGGLCLFFFGLLFGLWRWWWWRLLLLLWFCCWWWRRRRRRR
ncbi:hypothetical protein DFP73DRAFT_544448 [Morchella snyderi]|nr:hypothetical protein DFP73DRAFT_544448 [Morchella snyderi]